jgi:hypothetical protein
MPPKKKSVEKKSKPLIEESTHSGFYDIITSKEFINFNKDFAKNLIAMYIYKTVYDAAAPSRPVIAPEPEPEPIRRGIVVPARRGIVVEGREVQPPRDNDGFTEIVFRDRPAEYPAEFGENDFGVASESISVPFNNIFEPGELELEQAAAAAIMARIEESNKKLNGRGFTDDLKHVGKEAFKALLLAGLAGAVGTYAIKSAENERNLNYDAENTTPYIIPPRSSPYNLEERAKNWTAEVKNKNQMHDILSEFDDISDISSDSSGLSHFSSGSYGLGLKKTKKIRGEISDTELFHQVSKRVNNKIKEGIKYIYDHSPDKKTIMTFIAVIFALGTALIFANSQSLTEEAINGVMNFSHILSDCANGRVTFNGVKAYVEYYLNMAMPRGGGLKKKPLKMIQTPENAIQAPEIKETFYEKRIKPIAKKAYDIITSDESITVAKTLAQIAFLTLVMYGVKEAGTAIYGAVTPSPESLRTARQDLTELAESEIARPTFYTNYTVRDHGKIMEYDKSQYPKYWDVDVGKENPYAGENYEPTPISKINKILGEATKNSGYMGKVQTENLINTLKEISEYDKNKYDAEVRQAVRDVSARKITPEDALKIMRNKPTHPHIKNLMLKNKILRETSPKKWDLKSRKYVVDEPHPFVEEFREHLPTLKEKINWKKGQMLSGKGLDESIEYSKTKLKQIAKKIYNTMKSDYGQAAIKGITTATILAGLTALLHSRQRAAEAVLSPEELKEQYMNRIGEDVLFQ